MFFTLAILLVHNFCYNNLSLLEPDSVYQALSARTPSSSGTGYNGIEGSRHAASSARIRSFRHDGPHLFARCCAPRRVVGSPRRTHSFIATTAGRRSERRGQPTQRFSDHGVQAIHSFCQHRLLSSSHRRQLELWPQLSSQSKLQTSRIRRRWHFRTVL